MSVKEKKLASVQAEIARERAESLARGSQRLRASLERLRRADAPGPAAVDRDRLVYEASEACIAYLVQREMMGFGRQDAEAIRSEFQIPADVWNRMGAARRA